MGSLASLQAYYDSGNNFVGDSMGGTSATRGGSSLGGGGRDAPPTITTGTTNRRRREDATQNIAGQTSSATNILNTLSENSNTQNMSDTALNALDAAISGRGGDTTIAAKDSAARGNISGLMQLLAGIDPANAGSRASGRVGDLSRTLMEQVLPGIFGGAEMQGTGGNLAATLAGQDASIRTAEAQNRAVEEAGNTAVAQRLEGADILRGLTSGTSAGNEQLIQLLSAARGSVENTTGRTTGTGDTNRTGATTSEEVTAGTITEDGESRSEVSDPLGWARLDAATGGADRPGDRALATFIAAGGDVGALRSRAWDNGQGDYNRNMLQSIQSMMGA